MRYNRVAMDHLTDKQHGAFREFTIRYRDEADGFLSHNPIVLARVVADDKPAAHLYISGDTHPDFDDPVEYLRSLCNTFGLSMKKIKEVRGWSVGRSRWRLDLLPTRSIKTDAYHRRQGIVYGYPHDAIESFINTELNVTYCDLVRADVFSAEEVAYTAFVSYSRYDSLEEYEKLIERGKRIRRRITELAEAWDLPLLDEYAEMLYDETVAAYRGEGYSVATMFPPDDDVTKSDVTRLLAD